MPLLQQLREIVQRNSGIDNVFDNQQISAFDGDIKILRYPHLPGTGLLFSVGRDAHEVDEGIALDRSRKIGQEEAGAFQNANQKQRPFRVIAVDLAAHFEYAGLNVGFGE